ncbi:MAG: hydrogenase expression protein HypE [Longimicrobiaceae bacterium]
MTPPSTTAAYPEASLESTSKALREHPEALPKSQRLPEGPLKTIHVFWIAGMSCDGCTVSTAGATNPSLEDLLNGNLPGLPKVILHHPVLSVEAGEEFMENFDLAWEGKLDSPYVVVFEGSIPNEKIAGRTGGYWSGLGAEETGTELGKQPVPSAEWMRRLAPGAAASMAIGTCATWGGVPSAAGNPTDSMSLMDFLGEDYRSAYGLPVINIPGCAPVGDNFTETVAAVLLFLQGMGPIPEFDALGRPAWLFTETVHHGCTRAGFYEEGIFAEEYGDPECLVEVGCWGPVVNCNIVKRGAINHVGGCMAAGGICIGCTMPGFPDKFSPFYKTPPGSLVSTNASRTLGSVIRRLRALSNENLNREVRWDAQHDVPTGWGHVREPGVFRDVLHYFYYKYQFWNSERPGRKRDKKIDFPATRPGRDEEYVTDRL